MPSSWEWEGLGLLVVCCALPALVARLVTGWPSAPRPGPPTLDPGPERPAVAALLIRGPRRFRKPAVTATVLDLAARGCLDLELNGSQLVCRAVRTTSHMALRPLERRLLERMAARWQSRPAPEPTPAAALVPDPRDSRQSGWYRAFEGEVIEEASRAGLVRPRLRAGVRWGLRLAALVPAVLLAWLLLRSRDPSLADPADLSHGGIVSVLPGALLGFALAAIVPGGVRLTGSGRAAGRRWLGLRAALARGGPGVPGQPLPARAVAAGVDPPWASSLTGSSGKEAWSAYGGRWRQVRVGSPAGHLTGPPSSPWLAAVVGVPFLLLFTFGSVLFASGFGLGSGLPVPAELFLSLLLIPWGVLTYVIVLAARNQVAYRHPRTFEGEVVRCWTITSSGDDPVWRVAVDDGTRPSAHVWSVSSDLYDRCATGMRVRVTTDGRGRLMALEPVPADPVSATSG